MQVSSLPPRPDAEQWPDLVKPLLARWSPIKVYRTGLYVLGYPPTWITSASEVAKLRKELEKS